LRQLLSEYLQTHGYLVLFVWTFLEGEAGLILAGFLAFQGYLNIFGVILTALGGSFTGDQFYFYLGRLKGPLLLKLFTPIARKFRKALRLIEKYGTFVAFMSRYTYGFRIILPIILGMTNMESLRFLRLNFLSALSWSILFSLAGYLFGKSASLFVENVEEYEPYIMLTLVAVIVLLWISHHFLHAHWWQREARRRLKRMKQHRADRERPG
jgi:membrane protein DedA with SNARE-associated domain